MSSLFHDDTAVRRARDGGWTADLAPAWNVGNNPNGGYLLAIALRALVEETGLIARWLAQPGVRIVRAEPGYASPVGSAGRWAAWAASARSARMAAEQALTPEEGSDGLREPHPTREQLFGRAGVDRLDRPCEPRLPGRHPFGVAG